MLPSKSNTVIQKCDIFWRCSQIDPDPFFDQKNTILTQNIMIFWNQKWLVEHHPVCSVRVIQGRGAASFPTSKKWQIYCRFSKNSFLIQIYKYKFKSEGTVPTSKRALSDGNVGLTRLWVYKGQKHRAKLHTWRQKCEKIEVGVKAPRRPTNHSFQPKIDDL